ncbi:MAG: hypothetical protein KGJ13_05355 [Patescibacteria group bacterium]|nr:hypothetical protein [Patescibacteria group bacterium]
MNCKEANALSKEYKRLLMARVNASHPEHGYAGYSGAAEILIQTAIEMSPEFAAYMQRRLVDEQNMEKEIYK